MSSGEKYFPFDFVSFPVTKGSEKKEPFIEKVEDALCTNLQASAKFGCRICNCHTHAGSKFHFEDFTEAELLFHNNYYNDGFAQLSYQYILEELNSKESKNNSEITHILLIGYENYSELFLQVLKQILRDNLPEKLKGRVLGKNIDYCEYEVYSEIQAKAKIQNSRITRLSSAVWNPENQEIVFAIGDGAAKTEFSSKTTMCVYIVPINTTLSTMDKMIAKFHEEIIRKIKEHLKSEEKEILDETLINISNILKKVSQEHLCLITLYGCSGAEPVLNSSAGEEKPKNNSFPNAFWEFQGGCNGDHIVAKNKFEYLENGTRVRNLVAIKTGVYETEKCPMCFPDQRDETNQFNSEALLRETPMFGVNRGSVVPMLQIGVKKYGEPIEQNDSHEICVENCLPGNSKRVWRLSNFLEYKHVVSGGNHFQYYFHTDKFLDNELALQDEKGQQRGPQEWENEDSKSEIEQWLIKIVQKSINGERDNIEDASKENETKDSKLTKAEGTKEIFDYLIAPRHSANSLFVHIVNRYVFEDKARIVYFDVDKEFRENLEAKYSDFTGALTNLNSGGIDYRIRFHFVDDSIYSGSSFLRAKNLLSSLTKNIGNKGKSLGKKELFSSAIILINRMSEKTREFYVPSIKSKSRFFYYVDVKLSSMRSFEDACTLCKLSFDFMTIEKDCATNSLAWRCERIIKAHEPLSTSSIFSGKKVNERDKDPSCWNSFLEKRYLFFISYLLDARIKNKAWLEKDPEWIDSERTDESLKKTIDLYYTLDKKSIDFTTLEDFLAGDPIDQTIWQIALIKAITRPFFTFHIRKRQAAFAFCVNELNTLLTDDKSDKVTKMQSMKIQTLVKGLADLNANFILRNSILTKLVAVAEQGNKLKNDPNITLYEAKRLFTRESLLISIKKNLVLSRDSTKSLLLEHILLTGKEDGFFPKKLCEDNKTEIENDFSQEKIVLIDDQGKLTLYGFLYLENNSILNDILCNDEKRNKLIHSLDLSDRDLYIFENFKKLWALNASSERFTTDVIIKYNDIIEAINKFAKPGLYSHVPRHDFSKQINNFLAVLGLTELQALAFFHHKEDIKKLDEYGVPNLFSFLTVAGSPEDSNTFKEYNLGEASAVKIAQAFYHDANINELTEAIIGIDNENVDQNTLDVCVIKNVFRSPEDKSSLIIRYGLKNNPLGNTRSDVKPSSVDTAIYLQLWGFDKANQKHLFALKLLLTLRRHFVEILCDVNLQEIIESRHAEMKYLAMSIGKAATHAAGDTYYDTTFILQNGYGYDTERFLDVISLPGVPEKTYDRYLQLLADERISSVYRKLIRGDAAVFDLVAGSSYGSRVGNIEKHLRKYFETKVSKTEWEYFLYRIDAEVEKRCQIKFKFPMLHDGSKNTGRGSDYKKWFPALSGNGIGGISSELIWITLLMAANCIEHSNQKQPYILDVEVTDSAVIFYNPYSRKGSQEQALNKLKREVDRATKIPPFVFPSKQQNLTLWTLTHMKYPKSLANGGFTCKVDLDKASFKVIFTFFDEAELKNK